MQRAAASIHHKLGERRRSTLTIWHRSEDAFDAMWAAIDKAEEEVLFLTYIMKHDEVGEETLRRLEAAARRGVKVRLMYDHAGNITGRGALTRGLEAVEGTEVKCFQPVFRNMFWYFVSGLRWTWSGVIRNHRKILVVDGESAFVGGLNIGNEYAGRDANSLGLMAGKFRDTMLLVDGPPAQDLRTALIEAFDMPVFPADRWERLSWRDWDAADAARRAAGDTKYPPAPPPARPTTALDDAGKYEPVEVFELDQDATPLEVISSNPWTRDRSIQQALAESVRGARERLWISSPYFSPPERLLTDIEAAARRGVDVQLHVGGRGSTDPPIMWWVQQHWYRRALESGAKVFEFNKRPGEVLHAKMWTADGERCSVGSFNLDLLSDFILETNVQTRDGRLVRNIERQFQRDLAGAEEITLAEVSKRQGSHIWAVTSACCGFYYFLRHFAATRFDEARDF